VYRFLPTNDLIARKVFGDNDNKELIQGILFDFFNKEVKVEDITLTNPFNIDRYKQKLLEDPMKESVYRQTIVDIVVSTKDSTFILEIQVAKQDYFFKRSLFYVAKEYMKNYTDSNYQNLIPVYSLSVLSESFFADTRSNRRFGLVDLETHELMPEDLIQLGFFEFNKSAIKEGNLKHWQSFFQTGVVSNDAPAYILKAANAIRFENLTDEERTFAEKVNKDAADWINSLESKYDEGARAKEKEVIIAMQANGLSLSVISKILGKSEEYIQSII
jgi:predicted transposase/invertase (TIGR01784 family)